jgi:hypothetical protein
VLARLLVISMMTSVYRYGVGDPRDPEFHDDTETFLNHLANENFKGDQLMAAEALLQAWVTCRSAGFQRLFRRALGVGASRFVSEP